MLCNKNIFQYYSRLAVAILVLFSSNALAQKFIKPSDSRIKFTGAFFNKVYNDSVIFRRHSDSFLALPLSVSLANDENARTNTGITIIFRTDASDIDIHCRMLKGNNAWQLYASLYIDGDSIALLKQKRDDLTTAGDSSFIYSVNAPAEGLHDYRIVLSTFSTIAFGGLTLTGNSEDLSDITLPQKPVYVAYGNSITHGRGQDVSDQTYPWVLAQRMGWELYNIAVGGSKTSVPMAEMLKNEIGENIDYMTILIGYNDAVGYAKDSSYYRKKLISFIDTVREGFPEMKIFVIGQTYTITTENSNGDPINFDDWRKVQKYVVDSLRTNGDTLIHFINGVEFTDYSSLNNPPDDPVHLGIHGAYSFGIALADTIKKLTNGSTGIFKPSLSRSGIRIYPNPAKNRITITLNNESPETIDIYSMTGTKVMTFNGAIVRSHEINIDVSSLPKGVYLIRAGNEIKKLFKQ